MTHRDELESLRARVESQEKDLRDARAELDVLRAAVHHQAAQSAGGAPPPGAMGMGPGAFQAPSEPRGCSGLRPATQRQLGTLMILTSILVGGLLVATTLGHRRASYGRPYLGPRRAAAPAPAAADPAWTPFVRFGHVTSGGEPLVAPVGSACAVEVLPVSDPIFDCRIVVRCDERLIYGASDVEGFAHCGAVPSYVVDERTTADDGDPAMTLDLAAGRVTVEERVGLSIQRLEIQLDPIGG